MDWYKFRKWCDNETLDKLMHNYNYHCLPNTKLDVAKCPALANLPANLPDWWWVNKRWKSCLIYQSPKCPMPQLLPKRKVCRRACKESPWCEKFHFQEWMENFDHVSLVYSSHKLDAKIAIMSANLTIITVFAAPLLYNKVQTTHGSRANLLTQVWLITKESFWLLARWLSCHIQYSLMSQLHAPLY